MARNCATGRVKTSRDVYLTVDLDFWSSPLDYPGSLSSCRKFFSEVLAAKRPMWVTVEHDEVLKSLAQKQYRRVINVDFHDDLCGIHEVEPAPHPGNWAVFVPRRQHMIYEWRMPSWQRCVVDGVGLCGATPYWGLRSHGWMDGERREGLAGIPWGRVDVVHVCLSPLYTAPLAVWGALQGLMKAPRVRLDRGVKEVAARWHELLEGGKRC